MLCLDGACAPRPNGGLRLTRVKAPCREELEDLVQRIAERAGRALECMGLLANDAESAWLDLRPIEDMDAMGRLIGNTVTCRMALGSQSGRKAWVLRTITPLSREDRAGERVTRANGCMWHIRVPHL